MIQILCQGGCAPEPPLIFKILDIVLGVLSSVVSPVLLIVSIIFLIKWFIGKKLNKEKKAKILKRSKMFFIISLGTFWIPVLIKIFVAVQDTVGKAINAFGKVSGIIFLIITLYYFIKWLLEKGKKNTSLKKMVIFLVVALISFFALHLIGNAIDSAFPNEHAEKDGEWVTCWCG